jgi:VCBS repeat protein
MRRRGGALTLCLAAAFYSAAAAAEGTPDITGASYSAPTTRYAHGVLGDDIEYGALELQFADGSGRRFTLPEILVFEDIAPRLADVTGDGAPEVITVESALTLGARLTVWNSDGRLASTPHIGQSSRWLAPVGAADLDGDGTIEIAYVDRPHLARILRIWRFEDGQLSEVAQKSGLTNHQIGQDFITGGIRDCGGTPEIITVNSDWSRIIASRFDGGGISSREIAAFDGAASVDRALACN